MAFGQRLGLPHSAIRTLGVAALLHDMGKMKIPLPILNKSSRLDPEEMRIVQRHPADGARLILRAGDAPDIAPVIAYEHHINYDGSGYPERRIGPRCHYASRLVHLCDVYDALRSPRPYREAWSAQRVLSHMETRTGSEFDPELATDFIAMMKRLEETPAVLDAGDGPAGPDSPRTTA
jgi:HD-GYP domain-containing protein (c-di-GMP phosphodiesterase class II)